MVNDPDQEITLEYDSNKQLVRVNNYWGRDWVLDWNNGNITKITYFNEGTVREVSTYEYTDYVNKLGLFIPDTSFEEFDDVILVAGYFGKITKNLPSKRFDSFSSSNLDSDRSYSYSGFNSEGYPTSIIFDDEDRVDLLWK